MRAIPTFAAVLSLVAATGAAAATVDVYAFSFDFSIHHPSTGLTPEDPVINLGDTIRWRFVDSGHTTTSAPGQLELWNSGIVAAGGTYSRTFTHQGIFRYVCTPHGFVRPDGAVVGMGGTITVVPAPGVGAAALATAGLALARRRR